MGLLDGLFGKKPKVEQSRSESSTAVAECPHVLLSPRWDNVNDIGHEDRATGYVCNGCNTSFTTDEVARLRATEKERLENDLSAEPQAHAEERS